MPFNSVPASTAPSNTAQTPVHSAAQRSPNCAAVRNPGNYYLPMDVSSRFGERLRNLRRERNLTQVRMAVDFGIDRSFISDVERGRKSISLPMLEVIALGLKMTLSELLRDL
jgi:ribosome-binding protein aMBF1 (putative translation factor)